MQLIVNADDLGLDHSTTVAIIESLGRGICSSATLMATGEAFEEACELVHRHKLQRHVGIHISLTEGLAQSEAVRRENRLCGPDGRLRSSRTDLIWPFTWHQEAMFEEMLAQVRRCRRAGIPITHMDSHHHVHELWDVGRVAIRVAQAEGIAFIRLARNAGASTARGGRPDAEGGEPAVPPRGTGRERLFRVVEGLPALASARRGHGRQIRDHGPPSVDGGRADGPDGQAADERVRGRGGAGDVPARGVVRGGVRRAVAARRRARGDRRGGCAGHRGRR